MARFIVDAIIVPQTDIKYPIIVAVLDLFKNT